MKSRKTKSDRVDADTQPSSHVLEVIAYPVIDDQLPTHADHSLDVIDQVIDVIAYPISDWTDVTALYHDMDRHKANFFRCMVCGAPAWRDPGYESSYHCKKHRPAVDYASLEIPIVQARRTQGREYDVIILNDLEPGWERERRRWGCVAGNPRMQRYKAKCMHIDLDEFTDAELAEVYAWVSLPSESRSTALARSSTSRSSKASASDIVTVLAISRYYKLGTLDGWKVASIKLDRALDEAIRSFE